MEMVKDVITETQNNDTNEASTATKMIRILYIFTYSQKKLLCFIKKLW